MTKSSKKVQNVNKIAVLRANALGDFIFALPALEALRSAYPEAEIVLLARDWHQKFLTGRPGPVDRVVAIPHGGLGDEAGVSEKPNLEPLFEELRQERFDIAIQLHGGGRNSNPFIQRLEAGLMVGMRTPDATPLDRWMPYIYYQPEIIRYLEVVGLVGASPVRLEPHLAVTPEDIAEANRVIPPTGHPLVALHPGATDSRRRWPAEKFAAVGEALTAQGVQIVVTGTEPERPVVEEVVAAMAGKAENLCGRLSLNGLAGLLSRCSVVISNDSGPLHLAGAVGAATVGLYWCGNLINAGPLTRTFHRPSFSWRLDCPVCGLDCTKGRCEHNASFIADIPTAEVVSSALDLLALR